MVTTEEVFKSLHEISNSLCGKVEKTIPESVLVNHTVYKITKKKADNVRDGDNNLCWGTVDHDKREIDISKKIDPEHLKEVLIHEIIHAIDWAAGNTLQEAEVHMLAIGIYGVLKDNPEVMEYVFGE